MIDKATPSAAGEAVTPAETDELPPLETGAPDTSATEKPQTQDASGAEEGQEAGEPEAENPDDGDEGKKRNRVPAEERIKQLTSRRRMAERERDTAIMRAQRAESEMAQLRRALSNPDLDPEQRQALQLEETLSRRDARGAREQAELAEVEAHNQRVEAFTELASADTRFPEVLKKFAAVPVTDAMARAIMRSSDPVAMANYMAQEANRAEVEELIDLTKPGPRGRPPRADDVEEALDRLAEIRAKLRAMPAARKVTNAPPPGTTLKGKSAPGERRSLEEMSSNMDEFAPSLLKKLGMRK